MKKACSKCGQIHDYNFKCQSKRIYTGGDERKLRSTNKWTQKSLEIRERANWLCEVCREQGIYNHEALEVHHIEKLKDNTEGLLDNLNLVCLCEEHHTQADAGEITKEYLKDLARHREEK